MTLYMCVHLHACSVNCQSWCQIIAWKFGGPNASFKEGISELYLTINMLEVTIVMKNYKTTFSNVVIFWCYSEIH